MRGPGKSPAGSPGGDGTPGTATELLMAGADLWQVLERMVRRRADLSLNQFNVLRVLSGREPDSAHASDLTRTLSMSSAHATTVLQQLEQRGLIERRESPNDRRRRVVRLTAEGTAALDQARPALALLEGCVVGALGSEVDQATIRADLRRIRLALRHALATEDWDCVGP
jgi:DNA-binding MarR family transcriptional regulator